MIFTEYKPIGVVCGDLIKKYDAKKKAYVGKLDPLAHGLITILTDDDTKDMENHMKHDKTYDVKFVIGITTDTDDVLGMVENNYMKNIDSIDTIREAFNDFPSSYNQQYHRYSSFIPPNKTNDNKRKPMWWWSQQGYTIDDVKCKNITFYEKTILSIEDINGNDLKELILSNLGKITSGDFRKKDIVKQWENYSFDSSYIVFNCKLSVSYGFYVRQFIRDLSMKLKTKLLVLDIHRVEIF